MEYRRLGRSGLQLSVLSYGSWVTFHGQIEDKHADELMGIAYNKGVNMFERYKMELDYATIFRNVGMGTTIFSPLAAGFLTGKYQGGIPEGSRLSLEGFEWLKKRWLQEDRINKVQKLTTVAQKLNASLAALAIAWCISNPNVTSAIVGATKKEQLLENFKALDVLPQLTPAVLKEIEDILENKPYWDSN